MYVINYRIYKVAYITRIYIQIFFKLARVKLKDIIHRYKISYIIYYVKLDLKYTIGILLLKHTGFLIITLNIIHKYVICLPPRA